MKILVIRSNKDLDLKQAQESLPATMSLSDIGDTVTSWADCYKKSLKIYNFSLWLCFMVNAQPKVLILSLEFQHQTLTLNFNLQFKPSIWKANLKHRIQSHHQMSTSIVEL